MKHSTGFLGTESSLSRRKSLKFGALSIAGIAASTSQLSGAREVESCIQSVPNTPLTYYLVSFDKYGRERPWSGDLCSTKAIHELSTRPITDVFIFSHGWMGDIPQAKNQYCDWISAMAQCESDIRTMHAVRPGFSPLLIGIHWPSLPFGDEELRAVGARIGDTENQIDRIAGQFADTPKSRKALQTILLAANRPHLDRLPPEVLSAFGALKLEAGLRTNGASAPPGADAEKFDPQEMYQALREAPALLRGARQAAVDDGRNYNLLYLLAIVSFWTMKDRARRIGESGGHQLLESLQAAVPRGRRVHFHLMGHSFGCIVVSASLQGPAGRSSRIRPVSSVSFMQGALSLWSFSANVYGTGSPGYFRTILDRRLVSGPILTTQSNLDTAVTTLYPLAAGVARQLHMGDRNMPRLPKYGGLGAFGIQGDGCSPQNVEILHDNSRAYGFKPGMIYNIECTSVIRKQYPLSGAHSDISHPEVAHAVWEAARVQTSPKPMPAPPSPPLPLVPPSPFIPAAPNTIHRRRRLFRRLRGQN